MKVVIIGGVAGGATAAARIRRLDEQAQIVVFEKSGYISYANCGLPYYIGGVIEEKGDLTLQTPQSFFARFRVDMRVKHEVLSIHAERKSVTVKELASGREFEENYDKLLISTGAKPIEPPFRKSTDNAFTLRTVEDALRIREYVEKRRPRSVVVAGGGFIGIEVAENLKEQGMDVTIVQGGAQLLTPLDYDMAALIHAEVRRKGIDLRLKSRVEDIEERDGRTSVKLKGGETLTADMVVLAIGVSPDTSLAKEAGLALGAKGSIVVNERMETSVPDIYAVGDAVQIRHFVTGQDALISLAGPANKQGRIAADNICGKNSAYSGGQSSFIIKVFSLTAASTGVNQSGAKQMGVDADYVILSPMSHAGYYPGGKTMTMKVLFERGSYRLLGAQIVGYDGVDKRIDVLATAIRAGMKAYELAELDLAYAPPYSSAKDPVNMAGFMIENIRDGIVKQWYREDEERLVKDGNVTLLDTRTRGEFMRGHIDGFQNIPVDELRERLDELDKGKPVYVICQSGLRSYVACRILTGNGFDAYNFAGGFRYYEAVKKEKAFIEKSLPCGMDNNHEEVKL
ncbi:MAG: FAD-dependent oxidoreductase [Christensenellaceae bacterium]